MILTFIILTIYLIYGLNIGDIIGFGLDFWWVKF